MKIKDPVEIKRQIEELRKKPFLARRERRYLEKLEGKLPSQKTEVFSKVTGILIKFMFGLAVVAIIAGAGWYITTRPNLPPIDMAGHIEQNPESHILSATMPEPIQKHMLEHADGKGKPGIVIQYNCKKYSCEKDLIDKLTLLVKKYPENVYLAPGNYEGKIIMTKLGKREIMTSYNGKQIVDFITK